VPTAKGSTVELIHLGARPADSPAGHREEWVQRVAIAALAGRLRERREHEDVTYFGIPNAVFDTSSIAPWVHHTIAMPTAASGWVDAVPLIESELRRARSTGFTQAEVDESVAAQLTMMRERAAQFKSEPAARIASEIARYVASGRLWQSPPAELAEVSSALQGLAASEVTTALDAVFPVEPLHLIVSAASDNLPKPERVLAAYNKSVARKIKTKSAVADALQFRYESFGAPGAIAKRERIEDLDLTLVGFANGVRLNLRPSRLEPERFRLRVRFPLNLSNIQNGRGGIADLAGYLLLNCNLHKQKQTELARLIKLHGLSPQFTVTTGTPTLTITGPAEEIPFTLQYLTALLSDAEIDVDHFKVALSYYNSHQRNASINPLPLAQRQALYVYTGNDSRVMLNPASFYGSETGGEATADWLREHILSVPFEVALVGDFEADDAIATASATLGTLTKRQPPPRPGPPLTAPKKATRIESIADLPASTSMSCTLWPLPFSEDPRQNAALDLATDVLRDRLLIVLREALGATYSPQTYVHRDPIQRDFAYAAMINTFDPDNARRLTEGSLRMAAELAQRGVSVEEFNRLREPARIRRARDLRSNAWWLTVASVAQSRPEALDEARAHEKIFDEVTLADVNAAARVYKPDTVTVLIIRPASAKPAATNDAAKKAAPAK
jgi:zinc protease